MVHNQLTINISSLTISAIRAIYAAKLLITTPCENKHFNPKKYRSY